MSLSNDYGLLSKPASAFLKTPKQMLIGGRWIGPVAL